MQDQPGYTVRRAEAGDIAQMCELLAELFAMEKDFEPDRDRQARGLKMLLRNSATSLVLVAESGTEIVGMCTAQLLISTAEGRRSGLIEDLIVLKKFRGRGVGRSLIKEICRWCKVQGISRLQLLRDGSNARALEFYGSMGWKETNLTCMRRRI